MRSFRDLLGLVKREVRVPAGPTVIREDRYLVDHVEDWSEVRSPGRARRRRRQGHPQRIRIVAVPRREVLVIEGVMYAHPVVVAEIAAKLRDTGQRLQRDIDRETLRILGGGAL